MLKFTKGILPKQNSKIVTKYVVKTDIQKIEEVRKRMHPVTNQDSVNHFDRIKELKSVKKD